METFDDEEQHAQALKETGFWGRRGAGCLVYARSTGRFLVALRSDDVLEPGTWGTWGGAVPEGMAPEESVIRELREESGFDGDAQLLHAWRFVHPGSSFQYDSYIAVIEDEFEPRLNWENSGACWVEEGDWPEPLHFGLADLIQNAGRLAPAFPAPR